MGFGLDLFPLLPIRTTRNKCRYCEFQRLAAIEGSGVVQGEGESLLIPPCFLGRGVLLLAMSFLAGTVSTVLSIKISSRGVSNGEKQQQEEQDQKAAAAAAAGRAAMTRSKGPTHSAQDAPDDDCLPFQSLGLTYSHSLLLRQLAAMLRQVQPNLRQLAESVQESHIASFLCLPVCIFLHPESSALEG